MLVGGADGYALLGHGGEDYSGDLFGDIAVLSRNGVSLGGGAPAMIGHGDLVNSSNGERQGDILVSAPGVLDMEGIGSTSWIGHRTGTSNTVINKYLDIIVGSLVVDGAGPAPGDSVTLTNDSFTDMLLQDLKGGNVTLANSGAGNMTCAMDMIYDSANALSFLSTKDLVFNSSVQNDGAGDINLVAGWDGATGFASPFDMNAILADPNSYGLNLGTVSITSVAAPAAVGSHAGETTAAGYRLLLSGSVTTRGGYAQLGYHGGAAPTGTLTVRVARLELFGGSAEQAPAQLGHGGVGVVGSCSGDIDVIATEWVRLVGGPGADSYAQVGHGGWNGPATLAGNISLNVDGNLEVLGGAALDAYAQVGNGAAGAANANQSGDITISAQDIFLTGGGEVLSYAQIGSGAAFAAGDHSGQIDITARDLVLLGGGNGEAYAQVGHGGYEADGTDFGAIGVTLSGGMSLEGGPGGYAPAHVGHGGMGVDGDQSGAITIDVANNLTMQGAGEYSYAQIGHGGVTANGNHTGTIDVSAGGAVQMAGGAADNAFAQIGHGGALSGGGSGGGVQVTAGGNLFLTGGAGLGAYAQIGYGGHDSSGDLDGDIRVAADGNLALAVGAGTSAYAQIGHGDDGFSIGDRAGNIWASAGNNMQLIGASIGHGADDGVILSGNTYIGVGLNNQTGAGTGVLAMDAASSLSSAPFASGGMLKIYVPDMPNLQITIGALLNGVAWNGTPPVGQVFAGWAFGSSPYAAPYSIYLYPGAVWPPLPPAPPPPPPPPPPAPPDVGADVGGSLSYGVTGQTQDFLAASNNIQFTYPGAGTADAGAAAEPPPPEVAALLALLSGGDLFADVALFMDAHFDDPFWTVNQVLEDEIRRLMRKRRAGTFRR
jgi:hypothetical protein